MKDTCIVIFSKNRTLQLRSLIKSITHFSDITEDEIHILYSTTPEIPYDPLIKEFDCQFLMEKSFFEDLRTIITTCDNDYVFFMVDDLIFRDQFSLREIESFLNEEHEVDTFSLRLGMNIDYGEKPELSRMSGDILLWDTAKNLGIYWRYYWEVCSSIYRKKFVERYLNKCSPAKITYPNPFESYYYSCMPSYVGGKGIRGVILALRFLFRKRSNKMACFETSKSFTQGVNMVAERRIRYNTVFEPVELHKKMEEGFIIDYNSLKNIKNTKPNVGSKYFKLVKDNIVV